MRDFKGKIVFVSGGASGAGLGQAKVFGREGIRLLLRDPLRPYRDPGAVQNSIL